MYEVCLHQPVRGETLGLVWPEFEAQVNSIGTSRVLVLYIGGQSVRTEKVSRGISQPTTSRHNKSTKSLPQELKRIFRYRSTMSPELHESDSSDDELPEAETLLRCALHEPNMQRVSPDMDRSEALEDDILVKSMGAISIDVKQISAMSQNEGTICCDDSSDETFIDAASTLDDDTYHEIMSSPDTQNPVSPSSSRDIRDSDVSRRSKVASSVRRHDSPIPIIRRPTTPQPSRSPAPGKLISPSKKLCKIPIQPGRPSIDAFWDAEHVNDWNDQHSPRRLLTSPRKQYPISKLPIRLGNPEMTFDQTAVKSSQNELATLKHFKTQRVALADSFLQLLDHTLTDGQIAAAAASTGGVKIIWSKTLLKTAGRASWRSERSKVSPSELERHFTIELAEKVIDRPYRLDNTLAHEFCHLANYAISKVTKSPHGASFKEWGRKASLAFGESHDVNVTTRHNYDIDFKYIWRCTSAWCETEYKRHSKSIDTSKVVCGKCKSRLEQIKPIPRGVNAKTDNSVDGKCTGTIQATPKKLNAYAAYVRDHFASVKKTVPPGSPHKVVMDTLAREYHASKATATRGSDSLHDQNPSGSIQKSHRVFDTTGDAPEYGLPYQYLSDKSPSRNRHKESEVFEDSPYDSSNRDANNIFKRQHKEADVIVDSSDKLDRRDSVTDAEQHEHEYSDVFKESLAHTENSNVKRRHRESDVFMHLNDNVQRRHKESDVFADHLD